MKNNKWISWKLLKTDTENHLSIIASQLPVGSWYEIIGEATIADAILDRLVHTAHRIELKGESLRKKL